MTIYYEVRLSDGREYRVPAEEWKVGQNFFLFMAENRCVASFARHAVIFVREEQHGAAPPSLSFLPVRLEAHVCSECDTRVPREAKACPSCAVEFRGRGTLLLGDERDRTLYPA